MDVHPFIAALRSDRAPQRQAQSAMEAARTAWRAEPGAAQMMAELERYGNGASLTDCPQLDAVFTGQGEAERLMALLSRHYCAALAANPIGHPPFRHGFNGSAGTILLARSGRAQIMLQSREPGDFRQASYKYTDATRFDAVLAGAGEARIVRARPAAGEGERMDFTEEAVPLAAGGRFAFDCASEAFVTDSVTSRVVMLRLLRANAAPAPSREYAAATGELLLQSAATIATSRQEAIIALLGRMGRKDAVPEIARTALGEGDPSLRWQALRECLALDTKAGFTALLALARRSDDPLAAHAGALRAQLLETHPQLAELEARQCPA